MNKLYFAFISGFLIFIVSCDLERIEPGTGNESKFNTTFGGNSNDFPYDVYPNTDGTFIVVGRTESFTADQNNQAYIVRVDKNGVVIDQNNFGYAADDWAYNVTPVSDGGYVMSGVTSDPVTFSYNIFLVKVNSALDEVWKYSYGSLDSNEITFGIIPTGTSDFLVGYTSNHVNGSDIALKFLRINANGSKVSVKLGATGSFSITEMIKTTDGKIAVSGYEYTSGTIAYTAKFNMDGSFIWDQTFPGTNPNYTLGYGVVELTDKSLFVAGSNLGSSDHDFLLLGYTEIGMPLDTVEWGGANADELMSITNTQDGEIVVLGYSQSFSSNNEIYLSKRKKSDGSEIWAKHFEETWTNSGIVRLCPDGGFVVCTGQNQTNADIIIVKTDANGIYE